MTGASAPGPRATEMGAELERFSAAAGREAAEGTLRTVSAALAAVAAVVTFTLDPPLVGKIVAGAGLLIAVAWYVAGRNAWARGRDTERWFLALHERGLHIGEGAQERWLAYENVASVEVDQERLEVVLKHDGPQTTRIMPRYEGIAIDDLAERIASRAGVPDAENG